MEEWVLQYLLRGNVAVNMGPNSKEIFLYQAEKEYNNGNRLHSIFHQARALYQASQERYFQLDAELIGNGYPSEQTSLAGRLRSEMNDWEKEDLKNNPLMQYAFNKITDYNKTATNSKSHYISCNFLQNITDPLEGVRKIEEICQQMPKEWTILQLCKGPRPETTYSVFPHIHELDAPIYITLLRHARSAEYPSPICLRFSGSDQKELFRKYANIANQFKQCINVDPKEYTTKEAKKLYWDMLSDLDQHIAHALKELNNFFFPWSFLFTGQPYASGTAVAATLLLQQKETFASVDDFCNEYQWQPQERVLFSLAALNADSLSEVELYAICALLTSSGREQNAAAKLLLKLQSTPTAAMGAAAGSQANSNSADSSLLHYPCILIVDERLDHFFWEELNVQQEFCRVNSLQCLWHLHRLYSERIHSGYLCVSITDGACVLNPDGNLPKTEMRMRCFFDYWLPNWLKKIAQKPTQDEMLTNFFKRSCYVYAGHGSGLQYINGKHIARQQMNCVVFLFGCDSSRLHSNGLYSELVGSHLYYHAAKCPTLVGTLMPGLDANMDGVATEILSRWIAPHSRNVLPWQNIERLKWQKEGVVKPAKCSSTGRDPPSLADTADYQMGSLCAVLARIHQRRSEAKYYNTVAYVCRGLPVWNCDVQPLTNK